MVTSSVVAKDAVLTDVALGVARDAEPHVDVVSRHHAVHRLDRPVTVLAGNSREDVRPMREAHEVGQRVHTIPDDLEGRLARIFPGLSHRFERTLLLVASDAARDWWDSGRLRPACVLVTVLAGNLMVAGVNAMAEGNRLHDIPSR